jgi:succinate dehydrogenase/fumarate reductase flavoprotein subunit
VSGRKWKQDRAAVEPIARAIDSSRRPSTPWWVRVIGLLFWDFRHDYELRMWKEHERRLRNARKTGSHLHHRLGERR